MSVERSRVLELVRAAAAELNSTQPEDSQLDPSEPTLLTADGGHLSSLMVVTFILAVEEQLGDALGTPVQLFDEALIADPQGPFRSIGSLVDHIHATLRADSS